MISNKRINIEKQNIILGCKKCNGQGCNVCFGYCAFIDKMAEAEIPLDYWFREMEKFYGDLNFKKAIINYINNIEHEYRKGEIICFTGHRGTGKTMAASCILKKALLKDYSAYYTNMVDVVSHLLSSSSYVFRNMIKNLDFIVIDEVDRRFFPSQGSQGLYGNNFENIIRTRVQNRLPTIMCTNSEDISQIFCGEFEISFASLRSQFVRELRAGGKDARKGNEKL